MSVKYELGHMFGSSEFGRIKKCGDWVKDPSRKRSPLLLKLT